VLGGVLAEPGSWAKAEEIAKDQAVTSQTIRRDISAASVRKIDVGSNSSGGV
jgi:hypothetical protein